MSQLEVRQAHELEAAQILVVTQRAIRESAAGYYDPAALDAWASGRSEEGVRQTIRAAHVIVGVIDGAVAGWTALVGDDVDQLYVDPDHGGTGVARQLYAAVERRARTAGLRRLTATASLRAAPAFQRFGFTERQRLNRDFNGRRFVVVSMAKELDQTAAPA